LLWADDGAVAVWPEAGNGAQQRRLARAGRASDQQWSPRLYFQLQLLEQHGSGGGCDRQVLQSEAFSVCAELGFGQCFSLRYGLGEASKTFQRGAVGRKVVVGVAKEGKIVL